MTTTLPYGSWPSPISAEDTAIASPRLDAARFVGDDIWWSEGIAAEKGRTGVFRLSDGGAVLPAPWSARTRVHEYGGGAWAVTDGGDLVFSEASDGRVYRLTPGREPVALTDDEGDVRYADLRVVDDAVWAVREDHASTGPPTSPSTSSGQATATEASTVPPRTIVRISLDGAGVTPVVAGSDFLASPSPRGDLLAWIAWDHPNMPWDGAELRLGRIDEGGRVTEWTVVAGGPEVAALQPEWVADDELLFSADESGRWNLHRARASTGPSTSPSTSSGQATATEGPLALTVEVIDERDADTGGGLWVFGLRWFAPLDDGCIAAIVTNGRDELVVHAPDGTTSVTAARPVACPVACPELVEGLVEGPVEGLVEGPVEVQTELCSMQIADAQGSRLLLIGSGARTPGGVWLLDLDDQTLSPVRGGATTLDPAWLPEGRAVTVDGPSGEVHAFAYPPTNPGVSAPDDELPPYVTLVHGGPTSHVAGTVSLAIAFFTSRGIGVLDVNYGGSTGYGRAYRERLKGQWGIVDVQDVAAAASGLASAGLADPARLAIKGGSAGGWTVLCALANTDVFAAGIDRYGVADLRLLAAETHDFEARYLDGLVGPLPEAEDEYIERSPLTHPERLTAPVLILQGADDPVVPPSQAEAVRDALAANGVDHEYILFEGESHGFRGKDAIVRSAEAELAFLGRAFGFTPAE
ncbi:MAG: prolyl oligopeptidase family serine peptidase [Microbacterium sp.]